jgi:hypothetical protein
MLWHSPFFVGKWSVNFCGVSIYNSTGGRGGWDWVAREIKQND